MRHNILLFLAFIFSSVLSVSAQEHSVKCVYLSSHNITDEILNMENENLKKILIERFTADKQLYNLLFSKGVYLFAQDKEKLVEGLNVIGTGRSVFMDMNKDSIISQEAIMDKIFLIKDKLAEQEWEITHETKIVFGKQCIKAVLKGNKDVIGWFTAEIPFNFGPAGYYGLPGLIVELITPVYTYTLQEISYQDEMSLEPPREGTVVTRNEFQKISAEKEKQLGKEQNRKITIIDM